MRALLLVAALTLAACSSAIPSPSVPPGTSNTTVRTGVRHAVSDGIKLNVHNDAWLSGIMLVTMPFANKCVPVPDEMIPIPFTKTETLVLTADDKGPCKDAGREAHFHVSVLGPGFLRVWFGYLVVSYSAAENKWKAKLSEPEGQKDHICPEPAELKTGMPVTDGQTLTIKWCPLRKKH